MFNLHAELAGFLEMYVLETRSRSRLGGERNRKFKTVGMQRDGSGTKRSGVSAVTHLPYTLNSLLDRLVQFFTPLLLCILRTAFCTTLVTKIVQSISVVNKHLKFLFSQSRRASSGIVLSQL